MSDFHKSVLLAEVINYLQIKPGEKYIDATLGGGGHTIRILEAGGKVLGIDVDEEAIKYVRFKIQDSRFKSNLTIVKGNFRHIDELARDNGFEKVAGIVFDLGVSSHQLDTAERGFSFSQNGELDMRMDLGLQVKAKDLLRVLSKGELDELFTKFGEERFAKSVASNIVKSRRVNPIDSTSELEAIVRQSVPFAKQHIHPATRIFQALRIAVNDELNNLSEALPKALSSLRSKGRIAVISFHSLEDRIVKHAFTDWEKEGLGKFITKKPVSPSDVEIAQNPRSRSAKLRVFEKK